MVVCLNKHFVAIKSDRRVHESGNDGREDYLKRRRKGRHTSLSLVVRGLRAAALAAAALGAVLAMPCPATSPRTGSPEVLETGDEEEDPEVEEEDDDRDESDLAAGGSLHCIPCCDGKTLLLGRVCCLPGRIALDPTCGRVA